MNNLISLNNPLYLTNFDFWQTLYFDVKRMYPMEVWWNRTQVNVCQLFIQVIEQCLHCHLATYLLCCFWPKILITPFMIIFIHLERMTNIPSLIAYHHLHDWLQGNILHINMDFNLDDVPQNDFVYCLSNMLDRLETGDLKSHINICLIVLMLTYLFSWMVPIYGLHYIRLWPRNWISPSWTK